MAGYYLLDSPSQKIEKHSTEYSIVQSDMRSIAQCATAAHNAILGGTEFDDICTEQNNIVTTDVCLDSAHKITNCDDNNSKKRTSYYLVTATGAIDTERYDEIMNILESYFKENSSFGLFQEGAIMSGGTPTPRIIPSAIIDKMELTDGQLVYITQYKPVPQQTESTSGIPADITCPTGTAKTFRFGRWQCIGVNTKTDWKNGYPAATGIGTNYGGVTIVVDAVINSDQCSRAIDNPLQISAHAYSQQVLIDSDISRHKTTPKFERARRLDIGGGSMIYISGTAAIRGEESSPSNDIIEQLKLTMENIAHLYDSSEYRVEMLRIYLKYRSNWPEVKSWIKNNCNEIEALCIEADICRQELLIEIEGIANKK